VTLPLQTSPRLERESRAWATFEGEHSDATRSEVQGGRDHREAARGGSRTGSGKKVPEACKQIGVTESTYSHYPSVHSYAGRLAPRLFDAIGTARCGGRSLFGKFGHFQLCRLNDPSAAGAAFPARQHVAPSDPAVDRARRDSEAINKVGDGPLIVSESHRVVSANSEAETRRPKPYDLSGDDVPLSGLIAIGLQLSGNLMRPQPLVL